MSHRIAKFSQSAHEILSAIRLHHPDKIEENKLVRQQSIGRSPVSRLRCEVPAQLWCEIHM